MKRNIVNDLVDRHNSLQEDLVIAIQELTKGKLIDFEDDGFEDEANNDLHSVDDENVYFNENDSYPLSELGFWDGINVIETIQRKKQAKTHQS